MHCLPIIVKMSKLPWCGGPNHHLRRLINCPGIIIIINIIIIIIIINFITNKHFGRGRHISLRTKSAKVPSQINIFTLVDVWSFTSYNKTKYSTELLQMTTNNIPTKQFSCLCFIVCAIDLLEHGEKSWKSHKEISS